MDLRLFTCRPLIPPGYSLARLTRPHCRLASFSPLSVVATSRIQIKASPRDLPQRAAAARSDPQEAEDEKSESPNILKQMKDIVMFAGPATGLWICGPLMSLIDTMVIGQGSSLELAALGPGTVFCDYLCYVFMFLSIATSNMVATSLAKKDRKIVQHQISMLLFVAFACGLGMFLFTKLMGTQILSAFVGSENLHMVPAADSYVQVNFTYI
ncbi:protein DETOXIFICATION 47, chloroplastic-like isoform X2 [Zingiber officinale]|uniref:protein DETOXIFICATION 47, chloroplastic-like isoform X2 n=1 Tax=Zingiber officinale TaxID=94328 RepID=UPI001C4B9F00|nr:protein DETOXIFICATION 47, chloroplastic-like isoform X2 [Zingiber officinale]